MSMILPTLNTKTPIRFLSPKISPRTHPTDHSFPFRSYSLTTKAKPLNKLLSTRCFYGPIKKISNKIPVKSGGFTVEAQNANGFIHNREKEEAEAREQSSMPERFRYLTKEAPDKPARWPWLIVLAVMLYTWRTVLWELSNWRRAIGAIGRLLGYTSNLLLALVFHFIGDPVTSFIRGIETTFYAIRAFYSAIVAYAPIPELTLIITLTSAVLSVAEATVPGSVNSQLHLLTLTGIICFAAVKNYISELFFGTLLVGLFGYARLVEKRDYVSSMLPLAAGLAAVGEPWVRVIVMASYLALAIFHHSNAPSDLMEDEDGAANRVPVPLFCTALAIGIRIAAKWAGYRHLTWMIV